MNAVLEAKREKAEIIEKAEALNERVPFTKADEREFNRLMTRADELSEIIERGERNAVIHLGKDDPRPYTSGSALSGRNEIQPGEVRTLTADEKLADVVRYDLPDGIRANDLDFGRMVRGLVTGDWRGAPAEQRVMAEGTGSAGGYLVPTPLSARVLDLTRNESVALKAGAMTVPMESSTLKLAKVAADPTGYWRAENAAITESDPTLGVVTLTAKALGALVRVPLELIEDAPNSGKLIQQMIAAALATELDRVVWVGSGSGAEPKGIYTYTGVQEISMGENGAAIADYSDFTSGVQKLYEKNVNPTAVVFAPRTWGVLDGLTDTTDQPLRAPASYEGLRKFVSNQIPINQTQGTSSNASMAVLGGFENVLIGMRTGITLEVARTGETDAFSKMQVLIRGYLRADMQLERADHLVRIVGIVPA